MTLRPPEKRLRESRKKLPTEFSIRNLSGRSVDVNALLEIAAQVLEAEKASLRALSLALVDEEKMIALHRRLLGREEPTDVIAFEAEEGEGEIIICVDMAERQAQQFKHSLREELQFLVAHGVLHVLGWDDTAPEDRERMIERQNELLRKITRS